MKYTGLVGQVLALHVRSWDPGVYLLKKLVELHGQCVRGSYRCDKRVWAMSLLGYYEWILGFNAPSIYLAREVVRVPLALVGIVVGILALGLLTLFFVGSYQ